MKPIIEIIRLEEDYYYGTLGILKIQKEIFCMTLEPPDRANRENLSSIPAQQYTCNRKLSPRFGNTFEVMNVPSRKNILFHSGNVVGDTRGCFLLGQHKGKLRGDRAILNSGKTFSDFLGILKDCNSFHLTIKEVY